MALNKQSAEKDARYLIWLEFWGMKDALLTCHTNCFTRIEAPHYRTLNNGKVNQKKEQQLTLENLFDNDNRVINLDTISDDQKTAKEHFEKYYAKYSVSINNTGRYVQVKDDGIYSYMYEISDDIQLVKNVKGEEFLEFFLL